MSLLPMMNCKNNLAAFVAFKSKYTPAFVDALMAELLAAEKMKGEQARSLEHESLRIEMMPLGDTCRQLWQCLKRYIADAFGPTLEVANWDAAGWQYYDEASNENWDKLREMCNMALVYMDDNEAKLKTDGFMPVDFKSNFEKAVKDFNDKYNAFGLAEENAFKGTADKITANNSLYDKVVSLCLDGQVIANKDEIFKALFSMQAVSELVKPTGTASVVVEFTNAETGAAVPGYDVTNIKTERTVTADSKGRAEMGQQAAGINNYMIVADGFPEDTITVDVKAGTKSIQKISLKPLIGEAAMAEIEGTSAPTPTPVPVS